MFYKYYTTPQGKLFTACGNLSYSFKNSLQNVKISLANQNGRQYRRLNSTDTTEDMKTTENKSQVQFDVVRALTRFYTRHICFSRS